MQPNVSQDGAEVALVLHDGRKVLKNGDVVTEIPKPSAQISTEIMSGRRALQTLDRMHRKLGDLPDIPAMMNPMAVVMVYTCVGLSDADIANALGAQEAQIKVLKESESYQKLFELFDRTVFEDAKRGAKHIIARASDRAATTLVAAMDSDDALIRLQASRDVIKFAGVSQEQETGNKMSGLHIRITSRDSDDKNLTVEIKDA